MKQVLVKQIWSLKVRIFRTKVRRNPKNWVNLRKSNPSKKKLTDNKRSPKVSSFWKEAEEKIRNCKIRLQRRKSFKTSTKAKGALFIELDQIKSAWVREDPSRLKYVFIIKKNYNRINTKIKSKFNPKTSKSCIKELQTSSLFIVRTLLHLNII